MTTLRDALQELSGINTDPFYDHDDGVDGWKPRFKVVDRRKAGDERAKEKAVHVGYQDELQSHSTPDVFPTSKAVEPEHRTPEVSRITNCCSLNC